MLLLRGFFLATLCFFCLLRSTNCTVEEDEQDLIDFNFDKWMSEYFDWLTDEQKIDLREMRVEGYSKIDDFLPTLTDIYDTTKKEALGKATEVLNRGCLTFIRYLTDSDAYNIEFDTIARTAYHPYTTANNKAFPEKTKKRLAETADRLIAETKDPLKEHLARKVLPSCMRIFLTSTAMIRFYNDNKEREKYLVPDSVIEGWKGEYLDWLSESEQAKLKTAIDEGGSMHDLLTVIAAFYRGAGDRLPHATEALFNACCSLAEYIVGKENATSYIEFFEEVASMRQELIDEASAQHSDDSSLIEEIEKDYSENIHMRSNALIAEMPTGFKQSIGRNYFGSCLGIMDQYYRRYGQVSHEESRDEL